MSHFHSTVTRRDFMKGIGLAGAGLGAAAAAAPVFHDLDELAASPNSEHKLPWYVKKVDVPTADVDWSIMNRYDKRGQYNSNTDTNTTGGYPNVTAQWMAEQRETVLQDLRNNTPGASLKDLAITNASQWGWTFDSHSYFNYYTTEGHRTVLPGAPQTPEEAGISRYQGTPEENAKMIRAAFSYFGAAHVSFQELDSNRMKMIFANDSSGKPYVFEDVDKPSVEADRYIIPTKCKWIISYLVVQNMQANKVGGAFGWKNHISGASLAKGYSELNFLQARVHEFVRTIGYTGVGANPGNVVGFAVLGGQGELSRANLMIHPVYGQVGRVPNMLITDLPLPTDKPIDFGATKFCYACKKCSELCPSGAISMDDEPSWETTGTWNSGGVETWYTNWKKCLPYRNMRYNSVCSNCQSVCVFSKYEKASIHQVVKGSIATTSIFNSFFRQMDDFFGYEGMTPEKWWNRPIPDRHDATNGRWW